MMMIRMKLQGHYLINLDTHYAIDIREHARIGSRASALKALDIPSMSDISSVKSKMK